MNAPERWRFSPKDTALLLLDPQNDYLAPGGGAYELLAGHLERNQVLERLRSLLAAARAAKIQVLYSRIEFEEGDYDIHAVHELSGMNRLMFDRELFRKSSWGAEIHAELRPIANDLVLSPHKSADAFYSNLPQVLSSHSIEKLIIAGMCINTSVEASANHARERGFDVTIARDAVGAFSEPAYEQAQLWTLPFLANLSLLTDTISHLLLSPRLERESDLVGARLYSNDEGWLGTIEELMGSTEDTGFARVKRPHPDWAPIHVPLSAITKASKQRVYLNMPGQLIDLVIPGWNLDSKNKKAEAA